MRLTLFFLSLALSSASFAAIPAQRFDLDCADTVETTGDPVAPYTAHYRIDLVSRQWCEDQCRTVKHLAGVQAAYIQLEGEPNSDWWHAIDREKGQDQIFSHIGALKHTSGQCRPKPFSGFAKFKTKF